MKAYTYLIGWREKNVWYYGVRYKRGCSESDLMSTYFTSSKYVHECIYRWGLPDVVQVRRKFNKKKTALLWEQKVLRRVGVLHDKKWLNRNITGAIRFDADVRKRMSLAKLGKKWLVKEGKRTLVVEELIDQYIKMGYEQWKPDVKGSKNPNFGKKHSTETRRKISAARKGINTNTEESNIKKRELLTSKNPMHNQHTREKWEQSMIPVREKRQKRPEYEGIVYNTLKEASEKFDIPYVTLAWKCRNKKDGWKYSRP